MDRPKQAALFLVKLAGRNVDVLSLNLEQPASFVFGATDSVSKEFRPNPPATVLRLYAKIPQSRDFTTPFQEIRTVCRVSDHCATDPCPLDKSG